MGELPESAIEAAARAFCFADACPCCMGAGACQYEPIGRLVIQMRAALAALSPWLGVPEGWREIDASARDGCEVLLYSPDADGVFTGYWQDDEEMPDGGAFWSRPTDPFCIDSDPTHWRPLPAAPSPGRQG